MITSDKPLHSLISSAVTFVNAQSTNWAWMKGRSLNSKDRVHTVCLCLEGKGKWEDEASVVSALRVQTWKEMWSQIQLLCSQVWSGLSYENLMNNTRRMEQLILSMKEREEGVPEAERKWCHNQASKNNENDRRTKAWSWVVWEAGVGAG